MLQGLLGVISQVLVDVEDLMMISNHLAQIAVMMTNHLKLGWLGRVMILIMISKSFGSDSSDDEQSSHAGLAGKKHDTPHYQ